MRWPLAFPLVLVFSACGDVQKATAPGSSGPAVDATLLANQAAYVLRGTVVTPDGVIEHGYVAIVNGRIASVSEKQPDVEGATINTEGIILPGFVDIHNHLHANVIPRWNAGHFYNSRYEWRIDPQFVAAVSAPIDQLLPTHGCDMNAWGELRALIGGTTSAMTSIRASCIRGLVRNLDFNSGFYGTTQLDLEHIINVVQMPFPTDAQGRAIFVATAQFLIGNPLYEALVVHAAEGTDAVSQEEFTFLSTNSLLNPKGVLIHGISLGLADFQAMAATGTALVWSPRSNLELYGTTANIMAALDAGVEIALAPDWAISGSSNMLDELKTAANWNREQLGGRLSNRQLVDMVTSVAARAVGVDDEVGAIRPGLRADLLIIEGRSDDAPKSIVEANADDVQLVVIGGVPMYGVRNLMERFWSRTELEAISIFKAPKVLATGAAGIVAAEIIARLGPALAGQGTSLAPLVEPASASAAFSIRSTVTR
jgi:hypothetical protein